MVVGWGIGEIIRQAVPPWLTPVVLGVTRFGNVALLLVFFTADYWFGDHRRGAHALSLVLAGMALITALKAFFIAPRPPESVRLIPTGGYSFPSGHATIATIGYSVLAHDVKVGSRRLRYAGATLIIILVALSRVALGVHFLRDVVAGIVVGLVFVGAAEWLTGHEPRPGFLMAIGLGVISLVISNLSEASVVEFGAILGAAVVWEAVDVVPSVESLGEHLVLIVIGLPTFATLSYISLFWDIPLLGAFLLNLVLLGGVIVAPIVVTRMFREGHPGQTVTSG